MAEPRFDEVIHAPVRLRICGLLRPADRVEFARVRDTLGVSKATLSKHLRVLAEAGYVELSRSADLLRSDARRLTWLRLTPLGAAAFDGHVAALQAIVTPD